MPSPPLAWTCSGSNNTEMVEKLREAGFASDLRVHHGMSCVDRGIFVPPLRPDQRRSSTYMYGPYCDSPQPLGFKATVSAPYIHAIALTELAEYVCRPGARILDIGCGSGIMLAYFWHMRAKYEKLDNGLIVGIEAVAPLAEASKRNLEAAGLGSHLLQSEEQEASTYIKTSSLERGIIVRHGDGWLGASDLGPFDVIHVGAYADHVPETLISQLKPGGRMIIPVGEHMKQHFMRVDKDINNGSVTSTPGCDVRFVPLKKSLFSLSAPQAKSMKMHSGRLVQNDWNTRYRKGWAYGKEPNAFLVRAFKEHVESSVSAGFGGPLNTLCLGAGQGRNAVYLVSLGHFCTAIDFSEVGLRKAELLCAQRLPPDSRHRLITVCQDLSGCGDSSVQDNTIDCVENDSPCDSNSRDVVVDIFSSLDPVTRRHALRRYVTRGLRPGGIYIAECFAPRHEEVRAGRALGPSTPCLVDPSELAMDIGSNMEILHSEEVETRINEGRFHRGMCVVTRLVARKKFPGPLKPSFQKTMQEIFDRSLQQVGAHSENNNFDCSSIASDYSAACMDAKSNNESKSHDNLLYSSRASVSIACATATDKYCRLCWMQFRDCICAEIESAASAALATNKVKQARGIDTPLSIEDMASAPSFKFSVLCHPNEFLRSTSTSKIAVRVLGEEMAQMIVVGGGDEQKCRMETLIKHQKHKSSTSCTFLLFPSASSQNCSPAISVSEMFEQIKDSTTAFAPCSNTSSNIINIIVPDGSWECCRAMVRVLERCGTDLQCVRLDPDKVECHRSPLIEALKSGQGQGRISTLEAIALFLQEAAETMETMEIIETMGIENCLKKRAEILLNQGLPPLVHFVEVKKQTVTRSDTTKKTTASSQIISKTIKKQWVAALRSAALKETSLASFLRDTFGLRYCCICGETLATPIRFVEHIKGKKHCEKIVQEMIRESIAVNKSDNVFFDAPTEIAASKAFTKYSTIPLSHLIPEPPDVALMHMLSALHKAKANAEDEAKRREAEMEMKASGRAEKRSKKKKINKGIDFRSISLQQKTTHLTKGEALLRDTGRNNLNKQPNVAFQLPSIFRKETKLCFDGKIDHDLRGATVAFLKKSGSSFGSFKNVGSCLLEEFTPSKNVFRNFSARQLVYQAVKADVNFLSSYEELVLEVVLPHLRILLQSWISSRGVDAATYFQGESQVDNVKSTSHKKCAFYYQYPPTLRIQPGPSEEYGRVHRDAEYGHQEGEVNFWMPLSYTHLTRTNLHVESAPDRGDFHPLNLEYGEIGMFHGSLCHHRAPPNSSPYTRVSLDFRVGLGGFFDPEWKMQGIKAQHGRRRVEFALE